MGTVLNQEAPYMYPITVPAIGLVPTVPFIVKAGTGGPVIGGYTETFTVSGGSGVGSFAGAVSNIADVKGPVSGTTTPTAATAPVTPVVATTTATANSDSPQLGMEESAIIVLLRPPIYPPATYSLTAAGDGTFVADCLSATTIYNNAATKLGYIGQITTTVTDRADTPKGASGGKWYAEFIPTKFPPSWNGYGSQGFSIGMASLLSYPDSGGWWWKGMETGLVVPTSAWYSCYTQRIGGSHIYGVDGTVAVTYPIAGWVREASASAITDPWFGPFYIDNHTMSGDGPWDWLNLTITTASPHGLVKGDYITVYDTNAAVSEKSTLVMSVTDSYTFVIRARNTGALSGTGGTYTVFMQPQFGEFASFGVGTKAVTTPGALLQNDVVGMLFDADAHTLSFQVNNGSWVVACTSISGEFVPAVQLDSRMAVDVNLGGAAFVNQPAGSTAWGGAFKTSWP